MRNLSTIKSFMNRRRAVAVTAVMAWCLLFFLGALPAVQDALENVGRIRSTSAEMESLAEMSAAGVWFEAVVLYSGKDLQDEYDRLFPKEKQREELFLHIARLAKSNGIDPFTLREIAILPSDGGGEDSDTETYDAAEEELSLIVEQFAIDVSDLPDTGLRTFRLAIGFDADYGRLMNFIEDIESVPRALKLHRLSVEPATGGITVAMEIDYYAQRAY